MASAPQTTFNDPYDNWPLNKPRPVIWVHADGRQVTIYADRKIRHGYTMPDEWPVLFRTTVPSLLDSQWFAPPGPDWTMPMGTEHTTWLYTLTAEDEAKAEAGDNAGGNGWQAVQAVEWPK